jgi:hypothetical protein
MTADTAMDAANIKQIVRERCGSIAAAARRMGGSVCRKPRDVGDD